MKNLKVALIVIGMLSFLLGVSIGHIQNQQKRIDEAGLIDFRSLRAIAAPAPHFERMAPAREHLKKWDCLKRRHYPSNVTVVIK